LIEAVSQVGAAEPSEADVRPEEEGDRMPNRTLVLAGLISLWLWPASLLAQSADLIDANRQGREMYETGRYEEALAAFGRALELSEREFGSHHPVTASVLNNLAELYRTQGRFAEAETLLVAWNSILPTSTSRRSRSCARRSS
jgi:tetratricopeptide (TPR) repeat protein